jgi:Ca2+-binding EF-hand superfamily protein
MLQQSSGDEVKIAREQTLPKVAELGQWDILTLRQWFNNMDVDRDGSITKHEWFQFIVSNPKFQGILVGDASQPVKDQLSRDQAVRRKQAMKIFRDVSDNSGTIGFDQFVEFFRRTGQLVEYQNTANPRVQMADLLRDFHNRDTAVVSDAEVRQMVRLAGQNLQGLHRKTVERSMSRRSTNSTTATATSRSSTSSTITTSTTTTSTIRSTPRSVQATAAAAAAAAGSRDIPCYSDSLRPRSAFHSRVL